MGNFQKRAIAADRNNQLVRAEIFFRKMRPIDLFRRKAQFLEFI